MPSVSIVDKLISQNRTGNQMNLFLNTSRQKKLESIVTWKKSRIQSGYNCLHSPQIKEEIIYRIAEESIIIHAFWTNSLRKYFENSFRRQTATTTTMEKKKSDQNVSLFCCVVLFDDWYRCNETSSNTIIECNKRGTVAETLLPSLYVTWLIIAVANHMHAVTETNTHSGLDAANESDDDNDDDAHGRGEHSHSHEKTMRIQARPRTLPVNRRCMSGCAANDSPCAIISPQRFQSGETVLRIQIEYIETMKHIRARRQTRTALGTAPQSHCKHSDTRRQSVASLDRSRRMPIRLLVVAIENELLLGSWSVVAAEHLEYGKRAAVASMRLYTSRNQKLIRLRHSENVFNSEICMDICFVSDFFPCSHGILAIVPQNTCVLLAIWQSRCVFSFFFLSTSSTQQSMSVVLLLEQQRFYFCLLVRCVSSGGWVFREEKWNLRKNGDIQ